MSVVGVVEDASRTSLKEPLSMVFYMPQRPARALQGIFVGPRRSLEDLVRAVDRLRLKPVIDAQYDFIDLPSALNHLDRGPFGKIVVRIDG